MSEEKNEKKDLEIVSGDGSNLNISPVYEHLNATKPTSKKPTDIVVPKTIKPEKKQEENSNKNSENNQQDNINE